MPPKSKKKVPPKKSVEVASDKGDSDDEPVKVVAKPSGRRSGRQTIEEPKTTRASRGSQKENGSSKRNTSTKTEDFLNSESDDEPLKTPSKYKSHPKKRKTDEGNENGESSKVVRNPRQMYEVEKIVAHEGNGSGRLYRIRWKGYGPESDTWEPRKKLECPKLLAKYIAEVKTARFFFL